jgi:hypothetical protein
MERNENGDDGEEQEVELLGPRRELVAEELERVDVGNPVRPTGQALACHRRVPDVDEDDERLTEEQRHDREVVAE